MVQQKVMPSKSGAAAMERARALRTEIIEEPHVNLGPQHREMWLRDPDGYVVVIAGPDGESSS